MNLKSMVLILNFSYEPLGTMSIEDAFINIFNDKVYVEEYEDRVYRSVDREFNVPSVIRLKHYIPINKRKRVTATKRTRIYIRDGYKCSYCGAKGNDKSLTLDHIIPKCRGGLNDPDNLVTCCFPCNQRKSNFYLDEVGMKLLHTPKHLKVGLDKIISQHYSDVRPNWSKYLFTGKESDNRYSHNT